jgi:hypothetical protein
MLTPDKESIQNNSETRLCRIFGKQKIARRGGRKGATTGARRRFSNGR